MSGGCTQRRRGNRVNERGPCMQKPPSSSGQAIPQSVLALRSAPSGGSSGASSSAGFGGDSPSGVRASQGKGSSLGCASVQPEASEGWGTRTRTPGPLTAHPLTSLADGVGGISPTCST